MSLGTATVRGAVATPMSRRKERLFGVAGSGRSKNERVLHVLGGVEIPVREDTCIRAFVRLLCEMGEVASDEVRCLELFYF